MIRSNIFTHSLYCAEQLMVMSTSHVENGKVRLRGEKWEAMGRAEDTGELSSNPSSSASSLADQGELLIL